jgi:hypothetical protein
MNNVIQFRSRTPKLLWSPRKGCNPAWRIAAQNGQVLYIWDTPTTRMRAFLYG